MKIFPRRQQFSKYHPQKQKPHLGKQSQCNTNWDGPAYLSWNPVLSLLRACCLNTGTSWALLVCKMDKIIYPKRKEKKKALSRRTKKTGHKKLQGCTSHSAWHVLMAPSPTEFFHLNFHCYHVKLGFPVYHLGEHNNLLITLSASTKSPFQ